MTDLLTLILDGLALGGETLKHCYEFLCRRIRVLFRPAAFSGKSGSHGHEEPPDDGPWDESDPMSTETLDDIGENQ